MDKWVWLGLAAALAGCAAPVYEGKYAYDDGWRIATVRDIGTGYALIATAGRDCREELPPEKVARSSFARVTFTSARTLHNDIVPVASGAKVEVDGRALVNMRRCDVDAVAP
jgi:N-acyl-D-aspartate/D-glutamate deacylase